MKSTDHYDVAIVGAGHGGSQLATTLRQMNFTGTIAIVSEESHLPYGRPPLSKEYLSGEWSFDRILLRPESFWKQQGISLHLGNTVSSVDPEHRTITLAHGKSIRYGALVWAAGARPRNLTCPGAHLQGIHTLRSRDDADNLRRDLVSAKRVAVVGGGYVGLEVAAMLSVLGKEVTVVEALDRVLTRVAGESLSRFYEAEHRARGVNIILNAKITSLEADGARVGGIRIEGRPLLAADLVVVGIGILPTCEALLTAGAQGGNGVAVDEYGRTSLPNIYAIGDCALHSSFGADGSAVRIESVQNATDMARTVAKAIMGKLEPHRALPWFWSHQYDLRLQTVGLLLQHDETVLRGETAARSFSIIYRREGRIIALDCVNAPRDFVQGRALVSSGAIVPRGALADTRLSLKEFASS